MPSNERPATRAIEGDNRERIEVGDAEVVPMGEFLRDPEQVLGRVQEGRVPIVITKFGRFMALIVPLAATGFEDLVNASKHDASEFSAMIDGARRPPYYSMEELESRLGVSAAEDDMGSGGTARSVGS
ncbi:type II toxin-antitoxin system Phd/YefM family antitoxin [Streptomyces agglomeratus]|uniref:type II toxin-antitoxin system Phd/YefM family antitoxin n=1 Tax=Streptomyces agglomeratus TaxID=285458 RepID=UPI00114C8951|nr:type II toxin-antitoxin system Phd/YefM family antitoxin [Streptomyces agglomeratus]